MKTNTPNFNLPMSVRGHVKMISKEPVGKKPDYMSIGGFDVDNINFDWYEFSGDASVRDDGFVEVDFTLRNFATEFFTESNDGETEPYWPSIMQGTLSEVYYEAGFEDANKTDTPIAFDLAEFSIGEWAENDMLTWHDFPKETINAYNQKENNE